MSKTEARTITIAIELGDALAFRADVLALKYAQSSYGLDAYVVERLYQAGQDITRLLPEVGKFRLVDPRGQFGFQSVLFVGVEPLNKFGYPEIRKFGLNVLASLADAAPKTRHVCVTIHGTGYGLDEAESVLLHELGHNLGLTTVAEGIEEPRWAELLRLSGAKAE